MIKNDHDEVEEVESVSMPQRGNKPLQERVKGIQDEVKTLKNTVTELIETIRSGQMAGGDSGSIVWKLYQEEKKQRMELFDRMLTTLQNQAEQPKESGIGSIESILAMAEDEKIGPMIQRLLGKEPDWERLIDKVLDRVGPASRTPSSIRPAPARPIATPEAPLTEVIK